MFISDVSNTFKPDIYNELFLLVVLSNIVEQLTFNDDNNVVRFLNNVWPLKCNDNNNVA